MLARPLAMLMDYAPAAQLPLNVVQTESDFIILPGANLQDAGGAQIDPSKIHQPSHGRTLQRLDQAQCGVDLRGLRWPAQAEIEQRNSQQQRKIVSLYVDGWSIQEIADELGLSAARASDEKYKAIHKLRASFADVENS